MTRATHNLPERLSGQTMPAAITHLPRITRWIKGLVTQRNPIDTPFSIVGQNVVAHSDALIDGANIEVTSNNTLMRRWGLTPFMSQQLTNGTLVDGFWTFRNLQGQLRTIATSNRGIYNISPSGFTTVNGPFGTENDNLFWSVVTTGDYMYAANGNSILAERWQPDHPVGLQTLFKWGIKQPTKPLQINSYTPPANHWMTKFVPSGDGIAGVWTINQPDLGIEFSINIIGNQIGVMWTYSQYPVGPGPIVAGTSTTPAGTTAVTAADPENGLAYVQYGLTAVNASVHEIIVALTDNTSLVSDQWGSPHVIFTEVLGNTIAPGDTYDVTDGIAFKVELSPKSDAPNSGLFDLSHANYDLTFTPGTTPVLSYFLSPFITLTDVLSGTIILSTRTDHGGFTNHVFTAALGSHQPLEDLAAVMAADPAIAFAKVYKTGTTGQLVVMPQLPVAETANNTTWTISSNTLHDDTAGNFITFESVNTNNAAIRPVNDIDIGYVWRNEVTGHVSNLSPPISFESKTIGSWIQVTADLSNITDPQVTYPELYATADGGSSFLLTPQVYVRTGNLFQFYYFTPDQRLNPEVVAPLNFANNPPPDRLSGVVKHTQRMWGFVDNLVYYSGGPDTTNGLGDEAWPPANNFAFPGPVIKIQSTAQGLMVFLRDDLHIIEGVDSSSYYPHPFAFNFGISNPRAEFYDGQTMFIYTTSRQLQALGPGQQDEIGFDIADQLQANFDPLLTKVVVHRGPSTDFALFISNGVDQMFRYAPNKGWSPVGVYATTTIGAIGSIEVQPGLIQLLIAPSTSGTFFGPRIYFRDYTSWQDASVPYSAFATVGGISLIDPGDLVSIDNIILQMTAAGSDPNVSILLNELTGEYQQLSAKDGPIFDPPTARPPSLTLRQKRWWTKDSLEPIIERANTLFIRLDFAAENAKSEVLSLFARSGV